MTLIMVKKRTKWMLYMVPRTYSLIKVLNEVHSMELKPQIDLSWTDADSWKYLTAITKRYFPTDEELLEGLS